MHSPFLLSWLRRPLRTGHGSSSNSCAPLYFRLRSSWRSKLPGPDFTNRFLNFSILFAFHRSLKIRIIRPRNRIASALITLLNVHTCDVSSHMIKIEAFMADDSRSCILDSFPGEKRHKEAFEAPCICFNVLAEAFRRYSEKVTC